MSKLTINSNGYLNEVDSFVKACTETYESYIRELLTKKTVADLSMNDMGFIRLVSSSSILAMKKGSAKNPGKDNLAILNSPVNKPSVQASRPATPESALAFLKGLSEEDRAKLLASING